MSDKSDKLILCDLCLLLCRIYVIRTFHQLRGASVVRKAPETVKGRRMRALPLFGTLVLREHKEKQEATRAILRIPSIDDDLIFRGFEGKPLLSNTVTHTWIKFLRCIGLKGIR